MAARSPRVAFHRARTRMLQSSRSPPAPSSALASTLLHPLWLDVLLWGVVQEGGGGAGGG